jgi:hypothetical protein
MDDLQDAADELAQSHVALADAQEEQVRLMEEVKALRAALKERDDDMRRAAASQVALVERLAEEEANHTHLRRESATSDRPQEQRQGRAKAPARRW